MDIQKAAGDFAKSEASIGNESIYERTYNAFLAGEEWMIEKACEWLITDSRYYAGTSDDIDDMIKDFKQAMMEE